MRLVWLGISRPLLHDCPETISSHSNCVFFFQSLNDDTVWIHNAVRITAIKINNMIGIPLDSNICEIRTCCPSLR